MPEAIRYSSFSKRGAWVALPRTRSTVNSTSIDVSSASPLSSPSPSSGVAVADEQQRAFLVDGQVDRDALAKPVVIHVAAPGSEPAGAEGLIGRRRDPDAAEHRLQLDAEVLQTFGGLGEHRDAGLAVELPFAVELVVELGVAVIAGLDGAGHDAVAAAGGVAVQPDAQELDRERVAGHRAFHVERARLRIAAHASGARPCGRGRRRRP